MVPSEFKINEYDFPNREKVFEAVWNNGRTAYIETGKTRSEAINNLFASLIKDAEEKLNYIKESKENIDKMLKESCL